MGELGKARGVAVVMHAAYNLRLLV